MYAYQVINPINCSLLQFQFILFLFLFLTFYFFLVRVAYYTDSLSVSFFSSANSIPY